MSRGVSSLFESVTSTFLGSSRGIKDVMILTVPQVVTVGTAFITSIFLARYLGPTELGTYALVLSVSGLAISLSDLGIGQTAVRYASRAFARSDHQGQYRVLRWAFRLRLVLTVGVSLVLFVFAPMLGDDLWKVDGLSHLIQWGLLLGLVHALSAAPALYFQSIRRFDRNAIVTTGQSLLSLAGILLLWWVNVWNVWSVIVVMFFAGVTSAVVLALIVPREVMIEPSAPALGMVRRVRGWFRRPEIAAQPTMGMDTTDAGAFAGYNLIATVIVMVTMRADIWLMGVFLDQREIGMYSAASRFAIPMTIILGAITTALWPRASAAEGIDAILSLLKKTLRLSGVVAAAAVVYAAGAPLLAPLVFGAEYQESVLLGHILCLRYAFAILVCPIGVVGYGLGLVKVYWALNALQLAVVLTIMILLLPVVGALAAALALLANELVGTLATVLVMLHRVRRAKILSPPSSHD